MRGPCIRAAPNIRKMVVRIGLEMGATALQTGDQAPLTCKDGSQQHYGGHVLGMIKPSWLSP